MKIEAEHRRFFKIWNDCFTSPKIVLGVAYGKDAGGIEEKLGPKTSVIWADQSTNETMQDLISRGPWDVIIDDGSPVPWNRELGQGTGDRELETGDLGQGTGGSKLGTRNWGRGTGGSKLGTGNWGQGSGDRELGAANWKQGTGDRELGTGNWDRQLGTGNWGQGTGPRGPS